jgi:NDP-sugar pyrophosphorylase family protein
MQAMLFAAGLGTRLYPITKDRPKALAELNGITLLEHNIRFLAAQGFNRIVVNTHHFADKVREFLESKNKFGLDIHISYEEDLLDTAGGLAKAAGFFTEENIVLFNVDVVSNIDLQKMMDWHIKNDALATLALRRRTSSRYLLFDAAMRLQGWRNTKSGEEILCRPDIDSARLQEFAFSGIHIVHRRIFERRGPLRKHSLTPFYLEQAATEKIVGMPHDDDYWFDCGKPETLAAAANFLKA